MKTVSVSRAREIDRVAVEEYGLAVLAMMENAAREIVLETLRRYPAARRVAVACGGGNNGGDGLAAARHLANRGVEPVVALARPGHTLRDAVFTNWRIARRMGLSIFEVGEAGEMERFLSRVAGSRAAGVDVWVDALLGTGSRGDLREPVVSLVRAMNADGKPIVAVDVPTGLDAESGAAGAVCVKAAVTVTFMAPKPGMMKPDAKQHVGEVVVVDIGIPRALIDGAAP